MQLKARVIDRLPIACGTSRAGKSWAKATLIVETLGQYPKNIAMSNMNRPDEFLTLPAGAVVTFEVEVDSREHNGRWYTEVSCRSWRVEPV